MKVEIVTKEKENKQPDYPYLGVMGSSNLVVLFTAPKSGICLNSVWSRSIGKVVNCWAEESFQPFKDKIVLQN